MSRLKAVRMSDVPSIPLDKIIDEVFSGYGYRLEEDAPHPSSSAETRRMIHDIVNKVLTLESGEGSRI